MRVSTKSWHYKFLEFMYDWSNIDHKDRSDRFQRELQTLTKYDYILRVTKNVFWASFAVSFVIALIGMLISESLMLPLLAIAFIIGVCIAISETYKKYNAKCAKIEMTDDEETTDGTV
jgi:Mg2+/citrate symporter